MLVKLLPEQVAESWQILSPMIARALPPSISPHPRIMKMVLEAMMLGRITGWLICEPDQENGEMRTLGFGTTLMGVDEATLEKNLIIYTLCTLEHVSGKIWREGYETLRKYAESKQCRNIIAYSSVKRIVDIAEAVGANVDTTVIRMEV